MFRKCIGSPAFYYAIVKEDSVLFQYSEGNHRVLDTNPINEHSQFALYSTTKTFTTIAILQLQEHGKLLVDDMVSDYLPQYPFLNGITIRHLLLHHSGLNNPLPLKWIHLEDENRAFDYQKFSRETLESCAKNKNKPGVKSAYSNLNFLLLGELIEKITGKDYTKYIRDNVLIANNEIGFKWSSQHAVTGYHGAGMSALILGMLINKTKYTEPKEGKFIPFKRLYVNGSAYGGLIASASGLNSFLQELMNTQSKILSDESKQQMFTEQVLNGKPSGHSLGWFTGKLGDEKYVHHAGGGGGFYLELRIYPELGLSTYVLTNKSGFSDKRILDKLDKEYLIEYITELRLTH